LTQEKPCIGASKIPKCVMANGKASTAIGRTVLLTLHDAPITVGIHVLGDDQLFMPLLLGLDFMCAGQFILKPHLRKYGMPGGNESKFLSKTQDALKWGSAELLHGGNGRRQSRTACKSAVGGSTGGGQFAHAEMAYGVDRVHQSHRSYKTQDLDDR